MTRALLALTLVVFGGCSLLSGDPSTTNPILSSGTSFGECLGYCVTDLVVDGTQATLTYTGRDRDRTLRKISHQRTLDADERQQLDDALDLGRLRRADRVYGCPDCADGGAEYVGADVGDGAVVVSFEYGTEVGGLDAYIQAMRDLRARFPEPPR